MHTTNTRTQAGMRQALPHSDATYGGINAGSIETSLADAFFGTEQGAGCARTPLRPCRMRNAESEWRASADAGYDERSGSGARAFVPGNTGACDAILHALPEQGQGSGEEEQLQHVLSGRASEEAAQETAQEGKEAGRSSRRKTGRGTESEPGTVAAPKSLFYIDKDALRATTMRAKNAPKATKTASASKAASKAACKTAAKTGAKPARGTQAKSATGTEAKPATKPLAGTGATANPSVQAMSQAVGQSGGQNPNALPAAKVFPRRAPKPLAPARRAVCVATDAPPSASESVPESVLEELQDDVREEDLPARVENDPEDMYVEEIPEITDFRDREAPPIPRPETGVGVNGSLYAIPDAASHFRELAKNNPAPEPVSSDNGPHGFDDGRDALGTTTYGTAGEIAVRQIASLRAQFAPTAEERLFGAQRAEEQVSGQQREKAPRPESEAAQADAQARASAVTPEDEAETGSANDTGGSGGKNRKKSRILLLGLVVLCLALAAGYYTLSGPEPTPWPTKQAGQQSAQPSVRTSEEAQRELAILKSLGLEAQEGGNEPQAPAVELADGSKTLHREATVPDPSFGTGGQGQAKPLVSDAAKASPKETSSPSDPAGDATLEALRALAMELDTVRTSLSTLDTVLGSMDERTVRVLEGLNTLQSAVQNLQGDLERALLAREARKARQARSAKASKAEKPSRMISEKTVARAQTQAGGPAGWRVQGLHEDFAILRDASGRDWKVRAGSSIEDLAIVDIDYAKGRVATSKGDLFWRR